jgi:carbonic anhydrase
MAVLTTGSTVLGCIKGMNSYTYASGTYNIVPDLYVVQGNPNAKVTSTKVSGLAYDISTGEVYIAVGTNVSAGGSTWRVLV